MRLGEFPRDLEQCAGHAADEPHRGDSEDADSDGSDEAEDALAGFAGEAASAFDEDGEGDVCEDAAEQDDSRSERRNGRRKRCEHAEADARPERKLGEFVALCLRLKDGGGVAGRAAFGAGGGLGDSGEVVATLGAVHAAEFIGGGE